MKAIHHPSSYSSGTSTSGNKIQFYNRGEPYYEFTNFYPCSVFIDGKSWPTTEHYFQAQKFVGTPYLEKIRKLPTPRDTFQLSRDPQVSRWRRADWETVKDDIMLKALRVKFSESCSVTLRDKLRSTGKKELVEHTSNDSYWGDGGNGSGQNKLGKLLMQVRSELRQLHGPYIEAAPAPQSRYTRDDSSLPQRQTPPAPRLRRSNSISSLAEHRSPSPRAATGGTASYTHSSWGNSGYTGHTRPHSESFLPPTRRDLQHGVASTLHAAKNSAEKGVKKVMQGTSKAVGAVKTLAQNTSTTGTQKLVTHQPSKKPPASTYATRSNQSSVDYNIVTNSPHTHV